MRTITQDLLSSLQQEKAPRLDVFGLYSLGNQVLVFHSSKISEVVKVLDNKQGVFPKNIILISGWNVLVFKLFSSL